MGYLDSYLSEIKKPRLNKKRVYVTDDWPNDNQFWVRDSVDYGVQEGKNVIKSERFTKYRRLNNGRWTRQDVFGDGIRKKIFPFYMEWDEFDKINTTVS